ncbi:lysophospholipid acyltransferase family protein [Variovorax sp. dw_954]|uniref:lysophospholipid acyltransferase family protein n=1 Tax=Variovorax sp. dw_954 TaxID=2720078 RepID=UPI001BD1F3B4|nr:lysophospholipid acyltransferase family protein [Variovorax sp. dw_954]
MLAKIVGWVLLGVVRLLTGSQARWYGCPPKAEQRIYFANHQSHADIVMIWAALPEELRVITRPIAARDYWANTPVKRWITTEVFHAVYVDRGQAAAPPPSPPPPAERVEPSMEPVQAIQLPLVPSEPEPQAEPEAVAAAPAAVLDSSDPLTPLVEALKSGDSIIIFPEGTRGNTGEPQKFKSGLYALAKMFPDVVLVPAWIDNIQRVMPKGEVVPVPILCSVTFGAPMQVQEGEQRRPFLERARAAVLALRDV